MLESLSTRAKSSNSRAGGPLTHSILTMQKLNKIFPEGRRDVVGLIAELENSYEEL